MAGEKDILKIDDPNDTRVVSGRLEHPLFSKLTDTEREAAAELVQSVGRWLLVMKLRSENDLGDLPLERTYFNAFADHQTQTDRLIAEGKLDLAIRRLHGFPPHTQIS